MKKAIVVHGRARLPIPRKIEKDRYVITSMTGNAHFTTPSPALASVTTAINALETAYIAAQGGGVEETAVMHAKEAVLDLLMKQLGYYVEGIANNNLLNADAIIKSAGMAVKADNTRIAREFGITNTERSGEVKLVTRYAVRASFVWQMNNDPANEAGWTIIGVSTQSKFFKDGLTTGQRYHFRVAVVDKNGQGPWSHVLNVLVT